MAAVRSKSTGEIAAVLVSLIGWFLSGGLLHLIADATDVVAPPQGNHHQHQAPITAMAISALTSSSLAGPPEEVYPEFPR
jgi:hypothetical protein